MLRPCSEYTHVAGGCQVLFNILTSRKKCHTMNKKEVSPQIAAFLSLVKELRLKKELSHQQLADRAGVHRSTISLLESQQIVPTLSVALKVAHALEVKLSSLIKKVE